MPGPRLGSITLIALAIICCLQPLAGAADGAKTLYTNPTGYDYQKIAEIKGYLWDGEAVILSFGGKEKLVFLDKPSEIVEYPEQAKRPWILQGDEEYRMPVYFKYLAGIKHLAAYELLPDMSSRIVGSWSLASTGYDPQDPGWKLYQSYYRGKPKAMVYYLPEGAVEIENGSDVALTGLFEKVGPPVGECERFTAHWPRKIYSLDNWREENEKAELLRIERHSDNKKFNIDMRNETASPVIFHPKLDLAAVRLNKRFVHVPLKNTNPAGGPSTSSYGMEISKTPEHRMLVIDFTGFKPKYHYFDILCFNPVWHPREPVLYMDSWLHAREKKQGPPTAFEKWELPEEGIPDFHYKDRNGRLAVAWNVLTGETCALDDQLRETAGSGMGYVSILPDGRIVRQIGREIVVEPASLPDEKSHLVCEKVLALAWDELYSQLEGRSKRPEFSIVKEQEPTREDPGRVLWSPTVLGDGSGILVNAIRYGPGESPAQSALDCEFYVLDWQGKVVNHHVFPKIRGTFQIREIMDDGGFRFERWMLPEEGSTERYGYEGDMNLFFNNKGELVRQEPILPKNLRPRFEHDLIEATDDTPPRVQDIYYVDAEQKKHSFKKAAGVEGEIAFVRFGGYSVPRGEFHRDYWHENIVLGLIPYPVDDYDSEKGLYADWYYWKPLKNEGGKLWSAPLKGVTPSSSRPTYEFNHDTDTITALRPAAEVERSIGGSPHLRMGREGYYRASYYAGGTPGEVVRVELDGAEELVLAEGMIKNLQFEEGVAYLCGTLKGEAQPDVWSIDAQGALRRLTDTPEEEERLRIGRGKLDLKMAGDESNYWRWRVNLDTLKQTELPKELQGG